MMDSGYGKFTLVSIADLGRVLPVPGLRLTMASPLSLSIIFSRGLVMIRMVSISALLDEDDAKLVTACIATIVSGMISCIARLASGSGT
jgi:hypothetical protein